LANGGNDIGLKQMEITTVPVENEESEDNTPEDENTSAI